jgi:hypothetical protein
VRPATDTSSAASSEQYTVARAIVAAALATSKGAHFDCERPEVLGQQHRRTGAGGERAEHRTGQRDRGQRDPRRGQQRGAQPALAGQSYEEGAASERRDRRVLGSGEAHDSGREPGEHQPLAVEREQREQQEEDAEGGRVGVRQHEVERGAREADGREQRRRERGGEHRQQPAGQRVERAEDPGGLDEPERVGRREAGAEDLERCRERVQPRGPVEVAHVAVGDGAVGDAVRGGELVPGVDLRHAPPAPRQRGQQGEEQPEGAERACVGARDRAGDPRACGSRPGVPDVGWRGDCAHCAGAGRTEPTRVCSCCEARRDISTT